MLVFNALVILIFFIGEEYFPRQQLEMDPVRQKGKTESSRVETEFIYRWIYRPLVRLLRDMLGLLPPLSEQGVKRSLNTDALPSGNMCEQTSWWVGREAQEQPSD